MKQLITIVFFIISGNFCFAQTQGEMNQNAYNDYQKADKELNAVYNAILKEYKSDTAFIRNLKIAQRFWVQFRDAEVNAKFPDEPDKSYGSVEPMCCSIYLTDLTNQRITELKVWLDGIEEGDACNGSVKTKGE